MTAYLLRYLFIAGLLAQEIIRFPHRRRNRREQKAGRFVDDRSQGLELVMSMVAWTGMEIIPLFYAFTRWLEWADYPLPAWLGWVGFTLLALATWLLWRAHADLGRNWSPTLQVSREQQVVTSGVYGYLRHPIYASLLLTGVAQALMLPNWIAGWSGLAAFLLVYLVRVPREEAMMVQHFGEEYTAYRARVGGLLPRRR
ncbi:MAG: isoprenylcysteine carboxylmethyltransferase family protein [Caldilineaceae bacterium]|jgi:protein-S-isoprenylcysteine O-methyltransferase Ste14|nr:isoprenylcysteine carboxylmethyltransferase family protein [Caldilineaceae bacterium]